jgi:hypothetical protein
MFMLVPGLLAVALMAQPADSIALSGTVVDAAGKPVPEVEVLFAARFPADGSVPTLARTMSDAHGAFRLDIARPRLKGIGLIQFIWAYRPGRAVGVHPINVSGNGALPPVRVTLAEPLKRTVSLLDSEGRPVAGARVAPVLHTVGPRGESFTTPDDHVESMTVTTDAAGVATLPNLPVTIDALTVRVSAPGIAPHNLPLPYHPGSDRFELTLGRAARLAGAVTYDSGEPAANVSVEVWVQNRYWLPEIPSEHLAMGAPGLIHFASGPVRTRADGSFETPQELMTGSSYRIVIRPDGEPSVASDFLTAKSELTTFSPLRLRLRRRLAGVVQDRQGAPVAGARVFLPSGAPVTTTDAQGRFLLEGVLPDRTYALVQASGFRFHGWPAVPSRQSEQRKLILTRTTEPPDGALAPQPPPISFEESRALARRALEPSLQAALAKGDDTSRFNCLRLLSRFDPVRALTLLETHHFLNPDVEASLRYRIAAELLGVDPAEAESIVAAIANPHARVLGYVWLAEALPAAQRERKLKLMEHASAQARAPAGGGQGIDPQSRLSELARVAGGWLDLGQIDKARALILEGLKICDALPPRERYHTDFLATAARIELDRVLSLIRDHSSARRRSCYFAIAEALATEHPAEAERTLQLVDDTDSREVPALQGRNQLIMRLCGLMSKSDPERARRLIAGLKIPHEQACAWALLALGLADRDKPGARSALAESIKLIDGLEGSLARTNRPLLQVTVAVNPAASILPIVEKLAPERLDEVFWKAVALMPKDDTARERGAVDTRVVNAAIFLARYDRQVADLFLMQTLPSASRGPFGIVSNVAAIMRAKADADPRGAVAMFESLPSVDPNQRFVADQMVEQARDSLITCLVEPFEEHWKLVWHSSGIPRDRHRYR